MIAVTLGGTCYSGRLILNREKQTVDLVLEDGTRYSSQGSDGKQINTYRFADQLVVKIDPNSVFPHTELLRGNNELSIGDLWKQADGKLAAKLPAHQEMESIQQRFSFPAACRGPDSSPRPPPPASKIKCHCEYPRRPRLLQ